jgi:hypothetical protein
LGLHSKSFHDFSNSAMISSIVLSVPARFARIWLGPSGQCQWPDDVGLSSSQHGKSITSSQQSSWKLERSKIEERRAKEAAKCLRKPKEEK